MKKLKKIIMKIVSLIFITSAILGIVTFFFNTNHVHLKIEVIYDILLDKKNDTNFFELLDENLDLKDDNKEIRLMGILISNTGNKNILKEYYDENDPLGFIIQNGELVEKPSLLSASNEYLKNNIQFLIPSKDIIKFPKILIDSSDYFVINLIVIHNTDNEIVLKPIGKISGQKEIKLITPLSTHTNSERNEIFNGNAFVQFIRLWTYGLIGLGVIILYIMFGELRNWISNHINKRRLIKKFKKEYLYQYELSDKVIFKFFLKFSKMDLIFAYEILSDSENLNRSINKIVDEKFYKPRKVSKEKYDYLEIPPITLQLFKLGFAKKNNESYIADKRLLEVLLLFIKFLNEQKYFNMNYLENLNRILKQ